MSVHITRKFIGTIAADRQVVDEFCEVHRLDSGRLMRAMSVQGQTTPETYIDRPNESVLTGIAEFLALPTPAICVIVGEHGYGKTTIKDFVSRVLAPEGEFVSLMLTSTGRYTTLQLQRSILAKILHHGGGKSAVARTREGLDQQITEVLVRHRDQGVTTVIWVDEGQTLSLEHLSLLRAIADTVTPTAGYPAAKVIVVGTPRFLEKLDVWRATNTQMADEVGAFDDRVGLYTLHLSPWSAEDICLWWNAVVQYAQRDPTATSPFDPSLAPLILGYSDGQPRTIAQLSVLALVTQARQFATTPHGNVVIQPATLEAALTAKLHQNNPEESKVDSVP